MDNRQREKLLRHIRNASPFLWGIIPGKNKEVIRKGLAEWGFTVTVPEKATYAALLEDLIGKDEGNSLFLTIGKNIKRILAGEKLDILRRYWIDGRLPDTAYLKRNGMFDIAYIFLNVNSQFDYVEGWTTFAGLWFEDIEPYL